jgi:protein-disulfide isomerase
MKTKDKISLAFTGILVLCALIITGFVIRQEFFPPEPKPQIRQVQNWQQLELNGQRTGPADAPVQIVEFFDYQCPYCKSVQPAVKNVQQKYPDNVSVTHEHYPLSSHEFAFEAAVAAECAGKQGKFKQFHTLLFANQERLGRISYSNLALEANIDDITSFNQCVQNQQTVSVVEAGLDLADRLGVEAIPAFIINEKLITGAISEQRLEALVQTALDGETE